MRTPRVGKKILTHLISTLAIGVGLIFLGLVMYIIGVMMFLDRGFLAIGNVSKNL